MDDSRPRKIKKAHLVEETAAPLPACLERVDQRCQNERKEKERPQLDPLGSWSVDGILSGVIGVAAMEAVGVAADSADDLSYASTASDYFFQLMFCAAT
ncbi:MAG: hypothetical protein VXW17_10160, partial [Pseudomonadota bacterium]|nr:hypothetical protein [Pseudomonadota bacterium]